MFHQGRSSARHRPRRSLLPTLQYLLYSCCDSQHRAAASARDQSGHVLEQQICSDLSRPAVLPRSKAPHHLQSALCSFTSVPKYLSGAAGLRKLISSCSSRDPAGAQLSMQHAAVSSLSSVAARRIQVRDRTPASSLMQLSCCTGWLCLGLFSELPGPLSPHTHSRNKPLQTLPTC